MRQPMRRRIPAVLAATALLGLTAPATAHAADGFEPYVAIAPAAGKPNVLQLGDSYSSGVGAHEFGQVLNYAQLRCGRSATNWGQQFAERIGGSYVNAACGGATFADLTGEQDFWGPVAPQLDAVSTDADLVLMTMGGNDFGFPALIGPCFDDKDAAKCREALASSLDSVRPGGKVERTADEGIGLIRGKLRPDAKLIWLSYPDLTSADSVPLGTGDDTYDYVPDLRRLIDDFIDLQHRVADRANAEAGAEVHVVDTIPDAFEGNSLDQSQGRYQTNLPAESDDSWLIGLDDPYGFESYHPKQRGYDAYADALHDYYVANIAPTPTPTPGPTTPPPTTPPPTTAPASAPPTAGVLPPYVAIPAQASKPAVVQLGDSYSSGVGAHPFGRLTYVQNLRCGRSETTYGQLFAERIGGSYVNAACGGAQFPDLTGQQDSGGPVAPQVDAVTTDTDIVLMTMGGNDFGFGGLGVCVDQEDAVACRQNLAQTLDSVRPDGLVERRADEGIARIREKLRPDAKLIWLSYPDLTEADSVTIGTGDERYDYAPDLLQATDDFIALQRRVANRANATPGAQVYVVDTIPEVFDGHSIDQNRGKYQTHNPARPEDAWLIGIRDPYGPEAYHPKQIGFDAYADALHAFYTERILAPSATPTPSPTGPDHPGPTSASQPPLGTSSPTGASGEPNKPADGAGTTARPPLADTGGPGPGLLVGLLGGATGIGLLIRRRH
ncbi:lysophospholipase L1-like esterase [Naumannella cuiyingiana]|uniref:Lysophospholipase L1-like esterase n=1 Tax=Naumannella cuiyingiana TaxID=1347891 RepID=A0A7Z0IJM6_9ACTN|nr:SGNH/GDSL hydrolase family protein [Naumannella cuiyingiana]NYI69678.1 lysophospholipase L1-like esterase [Naumannella cuiyingiana]